MLLLNYFHSLLTLGVKSANTTWSEDGLKTVAALTDSSVGIATRYGLDGPVFESRWGWGGGARFSTPVQTVPGTHPASSTMATGSLPGSKALGVWR
jgi:hypothetical protein